MGGGGGGGGLGLERGRRGERWVWKGEGGCR